MPQKRNPKPARLAAAPKLQCTGAEYAKGRHTLVTWGDGQETDPTGSVEDIHLAPEEFAVIRRHLDLLRQPARKPAEDANAEAAAMLETEINENVATLLKEGTIADRMFLRNVLENYDSICMKRKPAELGLAAAFEWVMRREEIIAMERNSGNDVLRFWSRFHREEASMNLETRLLKFLESASDADKLLLEDLIASKDYAREFWLRPCLDASRAYQGNVVTPVEHLIADILGSYMRGNITPAIVEDALESFRDNFTDAVDIAKRMMNQYRGVVEGSGQPETAGQPENEATT